MADGTSEAAVLIQKSMGKTLEEATTLFSGHRLWRQLHL